MAIVSLAEAGGDGYAASSWLKTAAKWSIRRSRMVRRMAMARHRFAGLVGTDDDKEPQKSALITGETLSVSGGFSMA
jgi:hypothetical protein